MDSLTISKPNGGSHPGTQPNRYPSSESSLMVIILVGYNYRSRRVTGQYTRRS